MTQRPPRPSPRQSFYNAMGRTRRTTFFHTHRRSVDPYRSESDPFRSILSDYSSMFSNIVTSQMLAGVAPWSSMDFVTVTFRIQMCFRVEVPSHNKMVPFLELSPFTGPLIGHWL